jgi:hypothetical protein
LAALWTISPCGEMTNRVLKKRSSMTSGQRALHWATMYVPYCRASAASRPVSGPGMSTNRSRAAVTCGTSKISSVNPVRAPSASAISRTGMLMPMIDTAAWIPSSTICRLRSMSLRLPIPCTMVESPTAI